MERTRFLEITVKSAEGLQISGRPIKDNAFVIVRSDSRNFRSTRMSTSGGIEPHWNEMLELPLPSTVRSISIEVCADTGSGVETVGNANLPVSDFMDCDVPEHYPRLLSYRLKERDGKRNGVVNLSVRVNDHEVVDSLDGGGAAVGVPVCWLAVSVILFGLIRLHGNL